eukprot:10408200-Lingulodinium_polyedra.AAC.1
MGCGDVAEAATAAPASSAASSGQTEASALPAAAGHGADMAKVDDAKLRTCQECNTRHHYKAVWREAV